jgi:hypothetical protein
MLQLLNCGSKYVKSSAGIWRCFSSSSKVLAGRPQRKKTSLFQKSSESVWCSTEFNSNSVLLGGMNRKSLYERSKLKMKTIGAAFGGYVLGHALPMLGNTAIVYMTGLWTIPLLLSDVYPLSPLSEGLAAFSGLAYAHWQLSRGRTVTVVNRILFCKKTGVTTLNTGSLGATVNLLGFGKARLINIPPEFSDFEISYNFQHVIKGPMMSQPVSLPWDKYWRRWHRTRQSTDDIFVVLDNLDLGSPLGKLPPMVLVIKNEEAKKIYHSAAKNSYFGQTEFGRQFLKYAAHVRHA